MKITSHPPAVKMTRRFALLAPAFIPALAIASPAHAAIPQAIPKGRTLTRRQVRTLRLAMAERTGWLRLDFRSTAAIRRALCTSFDVPGLRQLPRERFEDALRFARVWVPTVTDPAIRACRHWRRYHSTLWRALDHMYEFPPASGYDVDKHFVRHHDRAFELLNIALQTPATTVAGIHAKLMMYQENYGYCAKPGTPEWESAQADPEYAAMTALAADTERLAA